jgi:hypothetical protein
MAQQPPAAVQPPGGYAAAGYRPPGYGAPPAQLPGHAPAPNPWAEPALPARDGSTGTMILLAGVLPAVLLVVIMIGVFVLSATDRSRPFGAAGLPGSSPSPTVREPAANDCAKKNGAAFVLAVCSPASMKVLAATSLVSEPADLCPDGTDEFGHTYSNGTLCLEHLTDDHPGAPGKGGGVLRAGDCLGDVDAAGFTEVPCADPKAFHRIVALTENPRNCPAGSVRALERTARPSPKRVVCGADAKAIASPGECVTWNDSLAFPDAEVPCSSRPVAKFMGRAATGKGCGKWSRAGGYYYWFERPDAIGPMRFNCYLKLS